MLEPERRSRVNDNEKTSYRPEMGVRNSTFGLVTIQTVSIFTGQERINRAHFMMLLNEYIEPPSNDTSSGK